MPPPEPIPHAADSAADPFAGDGRYRRIRHLGQGGMGEVLEIEHIGLGKRVVAKVLKRELVDNADLVDRFRFEAQVLARIDHPHLVAVLDVGSTSDGRPYFVMEKLAGRTAGEELRARKALPVAEAIDITCQVLAGLGAAHTHGLVHRDVKLDNVFLCDTPAGRVVKVLDFGVAKARRSGAQIARAPAYPTAEGTVMGTPRYIAPEQIRGIAVDARADVYATGMLLYTLLAGRSPFFDLNGLALLRAHLHDPPRPPSHWATLSHSPIHREIDAVVLRALAKAPGERFQTAADFADALRRLRRFVVPPGGRLFPALPTTAPPEPLPPQADRGGSGAGRARTTARDRLALAAVVIGSAFGFWLLLALVARLLGGR